MDNITRVAAFLDEAQTYYLATVEGDQPRVRPFGTALVFDGKLYIQTGKVKAVSKQLAQNPKAEICAFKDGKWVRVSGELVNDDNKEVMAACRSSRCIRAGRESSHVSKLPPEAHREGR